MAKKQTGRTRKRAKKQSPIFLEDLCKAAEAEDVETLDRLVFQENSTKSIRPLVLFQGGLPDDMFYALSFPFIKHAHFTKLPY
jgi:hypothetical protein